MIFRAIIFILVCCISMTSFAATTEDMSKIVGFTALNSTGPQMTKLVGFTVLNATGPQMTKIVGFTVLHDISGLSGYVPSGTGWQ